MSKRTNRCDSHPSATPLGQSEDAVPGALGVGRRSDSGVTRINVLFLAFVPNQGAGTMPHRHHGLRVNSGVRCTRGSETQGITSAVRLLGCKATSCGAAAGRGGAGLQVESTAQTLPASALSQSRAFLRLSPESRPSAVLFLQPPCFPPACRVLGYVAFPFPALSMRA
ncbi:hypothetical protein J1605_014118 [Eschrichtius robustus]|uniref:Uncharacterized protein n=1 Tax=Eschrichtius robustus TaxID=9764 RepID=A0AB34GGA6_ESCRO|nr:hypothetical protein J1605_014118 [Eschrichtius robustus]